MKKCLLPLVALLLAGCTAKTPVVAQNDAPAPPVTPTVAPIKLGLDDYLKLPQPAYKWAPGNRAQFPGTTNLKLTSQTWQGADWTHRIEIVKPKNLAFPNAAIIYIGMGSGSIEESFVAQSLATATGAYAINAFNVPNQPLYGKSEDDLVAYTFSKFLQSEDDTWPLLLPMTRSVVATMDAVQDWSQKTQGKKIERFIIAGASKRGWTTYLAGAADKRVVGIVPIVYNNLNIPAQLLHQKELWEQTSPLMAPYTALNLPAASQTPRGQQLLAAVDPWVYRDRLTMPKLLINATNDGFWPHDALKIYRDGLPGSTSLYYIPNETHFLGTGLLGALQSAAVWSVDVLSNRTAPTVKLQTSDEGGTILFTLTATKTPGDGAPLTANLFLAKNNSADFRQARWSSRIMTKTATGYELRVSKDALSPYGAAFAQVEWEATNGNNGLSLSSDMWETPGEKELVASVEGFKHVG